MTPRPLAAVARLELAELVRSRWPLVAFGVYGALAGVFVLVGFRESSVLGFTGLGRVYFSLTHALVFLLPLLALVLTGPSVVRARDEGGLELLLAQPLPRASYLAGVGAVRLAALALPLALVLLLLAALRALGSGEPPPWAFLARVAAVTTALLAAFTGIGVAISVVSRNAARALLLVLLAWTLAVALLDFGLIGLLLQWRIEPRLVFALATLNPVQAARLALLAGAEPDLATLGPVGFWATQTLGPAGVLALGIAWPAAFGALSFALAVRRFRRSDVT
jgi:ABC-type transport system involved in multi-copper enzyme maturation permease subunit